MKVLFLGTPEFAVKVLDAIHSSTHQIVGVITQPDKVNGRNNKVIFGSVKKYALEKNLPIYQFQNISKEGEIIISNLKPDVMVTCAYGQILRQNILNICPIFNVHASILPKYRGSSPVQWALINGEKEIGVTIMKTELGVDTGDILLADKITLSGEENSEEALALLSSIGSRLIVKALDLAEKKLLIGIKQDDSVATHCRMLTKADGKINFNMSSESIKNFIRGVTPWPSAFTRTEFGMLKVLKAECVECSGGTKSGEVVVADSRSGIIVRCGEGYLALRIIKGENGKSMDSKAYILGHKIKIGSVLGD